MDTKTTTNPSGVCLFCGQEEGQVKAGLSHGLQRYKCTHCQRRYIRDPKRRGHPPELRARAVHMHLQGMKGREIARALEVSAPTVAHWVRSSEEAPPVAPPAPLPKTSPSGPKTSPSGPKTSPSGPKTSPSGPKTSPSGWERATISDVARRANVSVTTISNYLNDRGHMREETRLRIEAAIERLHFSPNALIRAIQKRKTRIIGVLLFGIYELDENTGGSITQSLLAGMNTAADRAEYDILLYTGWPHRPSRSSGLDFLNGSADGLIWAAPNMDEPVLERVASASLPVVSVLSRHVPDSVGYVNLDNFEAMRALVQHLTELGHRRIAYAGPVAASNYLDRRDGYREALKTHGLAWDPELESVRMKLRWEERSHLPALARKYLPVLERWVNHPDPPTAILAADFTLAAGVISALEQLGRRVPEDISVCGFDDTPDTRSIAGGLTTVRQPFRRMGEQAVERLIALIEDAPIAQCRVTVPGSFMVGATTSRRRF